jgi:Nucleotidyl transferase AbiEii toxin, Type IV TA system
VVFDRLLARLLTIAPDRWFVKGGVALELRFGEGARTTKNLDLACWDNEAAATADLIAAQSLDLGDAFAFAIERTGALDNAVDAAAIRYRVQAQLADRRFETVILDAGFGDPPDLPPDHLRLPDLLRFADIAAVEVPALPIEQHLAEKLHAYTRVYRGERSSSRVKDLIDIVLIRSAASFEAGSLRRALEATFKARVARDLPTALPPPPANWSAPYRRLATEVGLDPKIEVGYGLAAAFVDSILNGSATDGARWEPERASWSSETETV